VARRPGAGAAVAIRLSGTSGHSSPLNRPILLDDEIL